MAFWTYPCRSIDVADMLNMQSKYSVTEFLCFSDTVESISSTNEFQLVTQFRKEFLLYGIKIL